MQDPLHRAITSAEVADENAEVPFPMSTPVRVLAPLPPLGTAVIPVTLVDKLIVPSVISPFTIRELLRAFPSPVKWATPIPGEGDAAIATAADTIPLSVKVPPAPKDTT